MRADSDGRLARLLVLAMAVAACSKEQPAAADSNRTQASPAPRSASVPRPAEARKTLLFLGTSLTAGLGLEPEDNYPTLIQRKIDSAGMPYRVVNAGVSGETSASLLRRLDWLLQQQLDVVVIETGANDGLRGVPVEEMRSNLRQIIRGIRAKRPGATIALIQMEAMPNMGRLYTDSFRASFPLLSREERAVLLPFLLDSVAGVRELNQGDGIHPNEAGERIVAQNVWKALKPLLR